LTKWIRGKTHFNNFHLKLSVGDNTKIGENERCSYDEIPACAGMTLGTEREV